MLTVKTESARKLSITPVITPFETAAPSHRRGGFSFYIANALIIKPEMTASAVAANVIRIAHALALN
jgi:hypothetical protein